MVPTEYRRARWAASAAYAVQGLCFAGVLAQVPALKDKFHFTEGRLTLILLAVPVVAGVGSLLAGALAPRFGSAIVLRVSGPSVCAAVAAIGLAPSPGVLYVAVAAFGLVVGAVDATMNLQGVAVQDRYGRSLLASFHGWWSLAGIAGALITAGLAALEWPISAATGVVAVVGAALALSAGPYLLSRDPAPAAPAAPARDLTGESSEDPGSTHRSAIAATVWVIGVAVMFMFIGESAVSNWAGVYLKDALGASPGAAPLGLAAYLSAQLAGRTVGDRVVNRVGVVATVAAGGVLGAAGFGIVVASRWTATAIIGYAVVGVGLCVVVPMAFSAAGALDPTGERGTIARLNLFNYAGFILGAGLIGAVAEGASLRLAFGVPAVLALGIVALSPGFRPAERSRSARAIASW